MNKVIFLIIAAVMISGIKANLSADDSIIYAVQDNDTNSIIDYLKSGGDVNFRDSRGTTALMIASGNDYETAASILLKAKADMKISAADGTTAFSRAAFNGHTKIVKMLLDNGLKEDIYSASATGDLDFIKSNQSDADKPDNIGNTALIYASANGDSNVVNFLAGSGGVVNKKGFEGTTALMEASAYGFSDICGILVGAGADVNATNSAGETALLLASDNGKSGPAAFLVKVKAEVNAKDVNGMNALMYASYNGYADVVKVLLSAGADMEARDTDFNYTAYMWAQERNHKDIMELLKKAGEKY